jgi:hypothetical protein
MGTGVFQGVKQPGRCVDHPPPLNAEVAERVELYLYSPLGLHDLFYSELSFTFTFTLLYMYLPI